MIEGLRRNGIEVVECHVPLWRSIEDRVKAASGGWLSPAFVVRVIRTYCKLLKVYQTIGGYDVMIVGYPGQLDVYLARILTWLHRRPLVLDVFMSIYLIALERGLTSKHPVTARMIYWLEKLACLLPDQLIIDTADYVSWFDQSYNIDPQRFRLVPTGADDRVFHPMDVEGHADGFKVVYYGTFIPNHGVRYIIEAARMLQDEPDIHFELIGGGPTKAQALNLARDYGLDNGALASGDRGVRFAFCGGHAQVFQDHEPTRRPSNSRSFSRWICPLCGSDQRRDESHVPGVRIRCGAAPVFQERLTGGTVPFPSSGHPLWAMDAVLGPTSLF
jgi:glycosyltransferase involved in cell wall biosynthesis